MPLLHIQHLKLDYSELPIVSNYRCAADKVEGSRDLAVYIDWSIKEGKWCANLKSLLDPGVKIFDREEEKPVLQCSLF